MTLIVLVGPTAVGKTSVAIRLAQTLSCPIINCDSRQIYQGMDIGTAAPTPQEMAQAEHYFVRQLHLGEEYSAARYEQDVLQLMQKLSATHTYAILSGGSMMYVDAVCQGIDDIPTVDAQVRSRLHERYEQEGLQPLLAELLLLDLNITNWWTAIIISVSSTPWRYVIHRVARTRPFVCVPIESVPSASSR